MLSMGVISYPLAMYLFQRPEQQTIRTGKPKRSG